MTFYKLSFTSMRRALRNPPGGRRYDLDVHGRIDRLAEVDTSWADTTTTYTCDQMGFATNLAKMIGGVERWLHHSAIFNIKGDSYRMKRRTKNPTGEK